MDTFVTRYIEIPLHLAKDMVLSVISKIFPGKGNMMIRLLFLFFLLVFIPPLVLFFSPYFILFEISLSLSIIFFYVFVALLFCKLSLFQRGWAKNGVFIIVFLVGIVCYVKLSDVSQITVAKENTKIYNNDLGENNATQKKMSLVDNMFMASHHSHTVAAAFFPSRGEYEIKYGGTQGKKTLPPPILWLYMVFHGSVYIFAGYLLMSLWGSRTINRLQFWLTTDQEKNVFWCNTPEAKMIKLAKDILLGKNFYQPVFSVEETMIDKPEALFQEMNFQKFCLKLRKPGQIHEKCLRASRHFFLSEDPDWNILMAENLVNTRLRKGCNTETKLYIRIENDVRKDYYIRWADQHKNKNQTLEIIFIDECALILDKFVHEHHLLETIDVEIKKDGTIRKKDGFKFLIIGFGDLGQEVLRHFICDSRFIDSDGKVINFHADIVDANKDKLSLFQNQYKELCNHDELNIHLEFHVQIAGSGDFYSFLQNTLNIQQNVYDRIVIALGDAFLNMETVAQIENIIRKNINLSQEKNLQKEIEEWKNKIFLISPETNNSLLENRDNMFTIIGVGTEKNSSDIYTCADIINEEIFYRAKLINLRYDLNRTITDTDIKSSKEEEQWQKANFYERQSSYAAALGLENIRLLLSSSDIKCLSGKDHFMKEKYEECLKPLKENLGKIEHLRWWAFMLCSGYSTWNNPVQLWDVRVKANQCRQFLRHATMVGWDVLPKMDNIFRNVIKISINKKAEMTSNLLLKAVVCNNVEIEFKDLPIRLPISLPIRGQIVISISCKSSSEKLQENLNKKLHDLSLLTGAEVELELKNNSGRLLAKKDNQILIEEHKKDVSEMYFAEFSVLEKSSHKVVGCKIKNGIVKIEKIENSENMKIKESQEGDCKEICVEQTLSFSGILQCNSLLKPIKDFQQKDFDLIEDLPYLLGIVKAKECGNLKQLLCISFVFLCKCKKIWRTSYSEDRE